MDKQKPQVPDLRECLGLKPGEKMTVEALERAAGGEDTACSRAAKQAVVIVKGDKK